MDMIALGYAVYAGPRQRGTWQVSLSRSSWVCSSRWAQVRTGLTVILKRDVGGIQVRMDIAPWPLQSTNVLIPAVIMWRSMRNQARIPVDNSGLENEVLESLQRALSVDCAG